MAGQSTLERFLLGAVSGGADAWYEKLVRDERQRIWQEQEETRRVEREKYEENRRARPMLPASPPLGTPFGGVVPPGMPGMSVGQFEDQSKMTALQDLVGRGEYRDWMMNRPEQPGAETYPVTLSDGRVVQVSGATAAADDRSRNSGPNIPYGADERLEISRAQLGIAQDREARLLSGGQGGVDEATMDQLDADLKAAMNPKLFNRERAGYRTGETTTVDKSWWARQLPGPDQKTEFIYKNEMDLKKMLLARYLDDGTDEVEWKTLQSWAKKMGTSARALLGGMEAMQGDMRGSYKVENGVLYFIDNTTGAVYDMTEEDDEAGN